MKAPYAAELHALPTTYMEAAFADVEPLQRVARTIGRGPALFVGSGGTMVLANLAARLHESCFRRPASACTSADFQGRPVIETRGVVLFTSSAKHPDAVHVLKAFRRATLGPTAVITHRRPEDVSALTSPDTCVVQLPPLAHPDGFLATGSVLQMAVMLLRTYMKDPNLPKELRIDAEEAPLRPEVLVLAPPSLMSVAVDIEVRLVESGLAAVQIADYRNFAHGRHTGFARRIESTTILALSDEQSRALAGGTLDALPDQADVRRWHSNAPWHTAVLELLTRSMRLVDAAGKQHQLDVARPSVPAFGRRLYRLPLSRRLPIQKAGGVERKLLAAGVGDDFSVQRQVVQDGHAWLAAVTSERFHGLVMDYDGTVCWTRRRFDLPDALIQAELCRLLDQGLGIGFASGRGRSIYHDLRRWVPRQHWNSVIIGMYNGAVIARLDEELADLRLPTQWSRDVANALEHLPMLDGLKREARGVQVTVELGAAVRPVPEMVAEVRDHLSENGVDAQVLASGHSIDIVGPKISKVHVHDQMVQFAGGSVLVVGDQGQRGGNDYHLMAHTPWSLSVNRCSADASRCWFAGDGTRTGPDLLARYLARLKARKQGFSLGSLEIQ